MSREELLQQHPFLKAKKHKPLVELLVGMQRFGTGKRKTQIYDWEDWRVKQQELDAIRTGLKLNNRNTKGNYA